MPATLRRRIPIGATRQNRGPIGFDRLHIHAKLAHQFNRQAALLRDSGEIAWVDVDDRLAIIPRLAERSAGAVHGGFAACGGREFHDTRQAAGEHGVAFLPITFQRHR